VTLHITARYADLGHGFADTAIWAAKNEILNDWCRKLGRDPAKSAHIAPINAESLGRVDDWARVGATRVIYGLGAPFDLAPSRHVLGGRDRVAAAARPV
jgi:hypothetical protein